MLHLMISLSAGRWFARKGNDAVRRRVASRRHRLQKFTLSVREVHNSRHNRGPIEDPLKPLGIILPWYSMGFLRGVPGLFPHYAEKRNITFDRCLPGGRSRITSQRRGTGCCFLSNWMEYEYIAVSYKLKGKFTSIAHWSLNK